MDHRRQDPATKNSALIDLHLRQGLVTVFTGDGRGKTTAAIGTAVRAAGYGLKVLIIFFMKGPDFTHGEVMSLKNIPGITTQSFGERGWVKPGQDNSEHKRKAEEALGYAVAGIHTGNYDMVVLDEIISAISFGLLSADIVSQVISGKPGTLELIMTGRGAPESIIKSADLVTEMCNIKHPFERGIAARQGIDY